jgi:hypothetical protein
MTPPVEDFQEQEITFLKEKCDSASPKLSFFSFMKVIFRPIDR